MCEVTRSCPPSRRLDEYLNSPLCFTAVHEYYSTGILIILDYIVIFMICYHRALRFSDLCSCYIHAGGDDMAFSGASGDFVPAQKMWNKTFSGLVFVHPIDINGMDKI